MANISLFLFWRWLWLTGCSGSCGAKGITWGIFVDRFDFDFAVAGCRFFARLRLSVGHNSSLSCGCNSTVFMGGLVGGGLGRVEDWAPLDPPRWVLRMTVRRYLIEVESSTRAEL